jgi:hypothetical protein
MLEVVKIKNTRVDNLMERKIKNKFTSQAFLFVGVTPSTQTLFQNEMTMDEKILWSGQPGPISYLTVGGVTTTLVGLIWLCITCYMEYRAIESSDRFIILFVFPFILFGLYIVSANFIYNNFRRKRIYYAITNQRVLILTNLLNKKVESKLISQIPVLIKTTNKDGIGAIQFDYTISTYNGESSNVINALTFYNIKDVDIVYKLVNNLRSPREIS